MTRDIAVESLSDEEGGDNNAMKEINEMEEEEEEERGDRGGVEKA